MRLEVVCASEPQPQLTAQRPRSLLWSSIAVTGTGIIKSTALRGGKEVVTDERAAVGLEVMAASVPQLLRLLYPALYPVHDPAGDWGRPGPDGRCARTLCHGARARQANWQPLRALISEVKAMGGVAAAPAAPCAVPCLDLVATGA